MSFTPDTFHILHRDAELTLCRTRIASDSSASGSSVLVRMPRAEHPAPDTVRMLEHEYALRAELDPTWAVRPLELTQHAGRTVLILEDRGAEPLVRLLETPIELELTLRLGASLAAATGQLHRRGIIHKDLKPAHVLVNPDTGQVWLTGFGIASRLPRERQAPEAPEFIAGTLPYMAPEQTGRMNRSVDSRSDLYALGVTLYEMLTGALPFTAADPMEWVHCHIARQALPPAERVTGIPGPVSAVVMKLLAKTAEERYQTAAGVGHDLRRCLGEWEAQRRIDGFPLAERDVPDRLLIPEKLYGRSGEVETLLASFDRVVQGGGPELVLVSGYSGIGKSSIVNELHKMLVRPRGLFASGKFDQYKRDIPYATLAQAFQSLIGQLLAKSEADLAPWRDALREALGANARLMIDLVPDLELIIGEQPPVPEPPPPDAQRRFQLVLRRFIGVFARPGHPLALFLDDLQWLDAATLDVLRSLLTERDIPHLMLVGAYRDNEVDSAHPLVHTIEAVREAGVPVREIVVAPLTANDLTQLVAEALRCDASRATALAGLVHEKTAGNPFFAVQFLQSLAEEGLLTLDHERAEWSWDVGRIRAKGYTDNVVDLMVAKLNRLPPETQRGLRKLASLGNAARRQILSLVLDTPEEQVDTDLWEATRLELVERVGGAYRFTHDRIREAAYSFIPERSRAEKHLRIGRLLAEHTPAEKIEEAIFEIVNHLNRGAELITSPSEREQLAALNLIAGKRAKASTAYTSALNYLVAGAELLPPDAWQRSYGLAFPLELHRAECEHLTGGLASAERLLETLSTRARTVVDLAAVTAARIRLYTTMSDMETGVAACLEFLARTGIDWSPHPTDDDVTREYNSFWQRLGNRAIEELIDLPRMVDPDWRATLDVLAWGLSPALFTDQNLHRLMVVRIANLSLEHGNGDASAIAYVWLGVYAGSRFGDYASGFRFGRLAIDLVEKHGLTGFKTQTYMGFAQWILPWSRPLRESVELLRRAFALAQEVGDLAFAAYAWNGLIADQLAAGFPLAEVHREAERALDFVRKARFGLSVDAVTTQVRLIRALRGLTPALSSFGDAEFDERRFEAQLEADPTRAPVLGLYWVRKLQAEFLSGDFTGALAAADKAHILLRSSYPYEMPEHRFFAALARAGRHAAASDPEREQHLALLRADRDRFATWAASCPENFRDREMLIAAEIARIDGDEPAAMRLYEDAARSARLNGSVHIEAIANELAARFYAERGLEGIAHLYLREARQCYLSWGADGKVRQLDEAYPDLHEEQPVAGPRGTIGASVEHLDLATVLKISQAVSGEIVLERLIDALLRTALEHAGAERGLLVLPRDGGFQIEAEARTSGGAVTVRLQDLAAVALPDAILQYAARTHQPVILDDASAQGPFSSDEYVHRQRARSILCLPLVKQGRLVALLYLENNLAAGAFTPARIAVLNVLASQAAMSLENGRLYRELQKREAKIRRLVDANVVGVVISTLDGRLLEANDAFLEMVRYTRAELQSGRLRWPELTPTEWRGASERAVAQIRATGAAEVFEKEYLRSDGTRVPVLVAAAALEPSGNEAVAFVLDLTERKRAEEGRERLRNAEAELARISRIITMGELTASIAHEIKQPITAAIANARACVRWLSRAHPDLTEGREAATRMAADATRAADIIQRLSSLFKKGASQREAVDVNEVIRETLLLVQSEAFRYSVQVRADLEPDLPPVVADRVQLQQVLMNLAINGIEAMKESSGELTVRSRMGEDGELLVSVSDDGVGLPTGKAHEIFDAFFTTKPQGTGMGLAISRSIIASHGGRLWAVPKDGGGTTFHFALPVEASGRTALA